MVGVGVTATGRPVPPAIIFDNVTLGYGGRLVLHDLSLTIPAGSLMALVGANGQGKSTLLKAIAGEVSPLNGHVAPAHDRATIAFLAQETGFDRDFPIIVRDVVAMGLWPRLGPFGRIGRAEAAIVADALAAVGLAGFDRRLIGSLSGGELQRVLFARLAVTDAAIILLDEPFAAMDGETVTTLLAVIAGWHKEGRTVIASLHDLSQVRGHFPTVIRITDGVATLGPTAAILDGAPRPVDSRRASA